MTSSVLSRTLLKTTWFNSGIYFQHIRVVGLAHKLPLLHLQRNYAVTNTEIEDNIKKYKEGKFDKLPDPDHLQHFRQNPPSPSENVGNVSPPSKVKFASGDVTLPHPIWATDELNKVTITHKPPSGFVDRTAFIAVQSLRLVFDILSGFRWGKRNEKKWLTRIAFLETVAAVPGMVAAMTRHFHSLRRLKRDYGWIHTLLEEAENERMHLMTALQLKQPSWLFRMGVLGTQALFIPAFGIFYLISPKLCHRFVGYLEEEAVKTYTKCLEDIESGPMQHWRTQGSPDVAIRYWKLPKTATMKDVILNIRADEAHHRLVNHTLASMKATDYNPYRPGQ